MPRRCLTVAHAYPSFAWPPAPVPWTGRRRRGPTLAAVHPEEAAMWPDGMRAAAAFTFDFDAEEVWLTKPSNADRPGVLSQGTYGAKVAVPLILELLGRHQLRQTFFVPGRGAERHADRVREILAAGHESGHPGHTHTPPPNLSPQDEEAKP